MLPRFNFDEPVRSSGIYGVADQIQKYLLKLRLVTINHRQVFLKIGLNFDIVDSGIILKKIDGFIKDFVNFEVA